MNWLRKIFGNKKKSKEPTNDSIVKVKDISRESEIDTYSKEFIFNHKPIKITVFNKELNILYKTEGFQTSKNNFDKFLEQNKSKFSAEDAIRLVSNYVGILKKEKIDKENIFEIVENNLVSFNSSSQENLIIKKSKLYKKIDLNIAINYLEKETSKLEKVKSIEKMIIFINALILLSEHLLKQKKFDPAFINLRRADLVIPQLPNFERISFSQRIAALSSEICLKDKKPKYESFLFFEFNSFLFTIMQRLMGFPHLSAFEYNKQDTSKEGWPFSDNKDFDKALEEFNMTSSKDFIIRNLNEFAFNKLPDLYGIPKKYDSQEKINKIMDNMKSNYDGWKELSHFSDSLKEKSIEPIAIEILLFSQNLFQSQYDKNNNGT